MAAAYGERCSIEQTSTPGQGTTILLHLPLTSSKA
jgi:chemotaxis protein histidine kinase CheA